MEGPPDLNPMSCRVTLGHRRMMRVVLTPGRIPSPAPVLVQGHPRVGESGLLDLVLVVVLVQDFVAPPPALLVVVVLLVLRAGWVGA